jgi:PAS domain S-box-containing protein
MKKNTNNLIIIAEDSLTQAEQLKNILIKNRYEVLHGQNGREAFDMIKRKNPQLVISDIVMPETDGYELCRMIKTDDQLKGIPVILLTVLADPADVIKGLECGADNFITKPYNEKYLLSRIHNILINKELRRERLSEMGIEIFFANKKYYITSDRLQILDLLLSTYENSVQKNIELIKVNENLKSTRDELETLNKKLEEIIEARTLRLKHINALLISIRNVNQLIVREKDAGKLIKKICASLVDVRGYCGAWILLVNGNMNLINSASKGFKKEFSHLIAEIKNGKFPHCCQQGLKQPGIVLSESHEPECAGCPMSEKSSYKGSMTLRLEHEGEILGILTIKLPSDFKTDKEEQDLLYEVAGDISFALYSINLEEKHRQAEDAFRKSEEKYRILFEGSAEGILVADIETKKFIYANPAICKMLGYTIKELEGMSIADIHPKDSLEHVISEFEAQSRGDKTLAHDIPCLRKNGTIIHTNINTSTALIDNKKCNVGFFTDINEIIEAELKLAREKELLSALIDNSPDHIYFKDKQCRFIRINKKLTEDLGLKNPSEALGKTDFDFFKEEHANQAFIDEQNIMRTDLTLVNNEEKEILPDKGEIWVSSTKLPLHDKDGNIMGICGISRDITERKRMEDELILAKEKAEESNKLKSAFLANMSHEIRTPMNAMLGFSSLLANPEITYEKRNEYIVRIKESSDRLLHLIDDIIDSSKIESGQLRINEVETYINKILTDVYSFFNELKCKKGKESIEIRLNKGISEESFRILTDPYRLKQVLSNLLDNALKYTDSGFIEIGYTIQPVITDKKNNIMPAENNRILLFYVKDTGIGFPENKKDLIFERFQKLEDNKVKLYEGTGLGLTISKNLARLLGGEIWAESELGKGSTFYFTLPYKPVSVVHEDIDVNGIFIKNIPGRTKYLWKGEVILIAEDEENNYAFIEEAFRITGARLIWVKNGLEAVEMCRTNEYINLVIMDVKMPLMDGYTATKSIKNLRKNLPVIALTAYADETEKEEARKAGCDNYISKPVMPEELLALVSRYI